MDLLGSSLDRFRLVAILEGISFLLLLFVAMPLKYFADMPMAVKYVGWAHGLLFMLFLITLLQVWIEERWKVNKVFIAFLCSLAPGAPLIFEKRIRNAKAKPSQR